MPHGWLILDKPRGLGSTQAVGAVKRVLRAGGHGKVKVGHGGTLDPLAEGVLPIALGEATKLAGRMLDASKTYAFTVAFGIQTTTLDTEGEVVAASEHRPSVAEVKAVLPRFTGPIDQVPPAFSALKVDGRRAYALARAGQEVELATRSVTIHALTLLDTGADHATLLAHVSKGTYIRSLARDIALALGTVGHVTFLQRRQAGPFTQDQAISLDMLEEIGKGAPLEDHLLRLEAGLDGIPALTLDPEDVQAVRQGRVLSGQPHADGLHLATTGDVPVALVEIAGGTMKVVRGFNL
ncbi:tRNA pseudouridine(55) synthase TruB [Croceibacterium sp. TMG7-5b_MA50]|uniref:tRNA pseudouridine(55) synthase TruB n=1 Tax=Croceibacterium sp. TMG7-5b_MA50 TaxID=3121290 RepID=UPI00322177A3